MKTLAKILGLQPRRWRRPKTVTAVRVEIIYSDGRPDLHMTLAPEECWDLVEAWAMGDHTVALRVDGAFVVVNLENIVALSHKFVQVLER